MLRLLPLFLVLLISVPSNAATSDNTPAAKNESVMSLLDNRFRVDPTISQITFLIYRSTRSKPVVLVRPDGVKYYAWNSPDNVRWYKEDTMDIISIDKPMPGPWQAVGKVTPKNNIRLISQLALTADKLPLRLYQGEEIKFSAHLTSDGKELTLRDFLDRVNLKVTLTKYIDNANQLAEEAQPRPVELGTFSDDGRGYDEKPGDGVFTVGLDIDAEPGKYLVRITSGNGVFLRAQEQEVLIYPTPFTTTFIQSRLANNPHHIKFTAEEGTLEPGSLMAHITHSNEYGDEYTVEGRSGEEGLSVDLQVPYSGQLGNYKWSGTVYATEIETHRPLRFHIPEHTYTVVEDIDYEQTRKMQEEALAAKRKAEQEQARIEYLEAQRAKAWTYIGIGNVLAIVLGLVGWFFMGKIKAKRRLKAEMAEKELQESKPPETEE